MRLADVIRLERTGCAAFVGAGGKTTALALLARQLNPPVWVSTSTHLGADQGSFADRQILLDRSTELSELLDGGITLFSGGLTADGRLGAPLPDEIARLVRAAHSAGIPLLIEADGSRARPLKAPAGHEPVIPEGVTSVILLAGLSGLSMPLSPEVVHRPEIFARLSGCQMGEKIEARHVAKVLGHTEGGLKGIPVGVKKVLLLNQADTPVLQALGSSIANELSGEYEQILIGSLLAGGKGEINASYQPVAGIILAGGGSKRLGTPKPLLHWRGQPFVRHVALAATAAGLDSVIVVVGSRGETVQAVIQDLAVQIVKNERWEMGQAESIKTGLRNLPLRCGAAIFLLADQPQVSVTLLRSLVEQHRTTFAPVIAPLADGQRCNPVLFDRSTFADLEKITGDVGGRAIFSKYPIEWLPWHDSRILLDIDTEQDYLTFLEAYK